MTPHAPIQSGATANPNGISPIYAYADAQHRQPFDLVPLLFEGANTLQIRDAIAKAYGIIETGYGKLYHRVRRTLLRLEKAGTLFKQRGLLSQGWGETPSCWWRLTLQTTNLIKQVQNSNRQQKAQIPPANPADSSKWYWARFPKRANPERITAAKLLRNIKTQRDHWLWQRESKTSPIRQELKNLQTCIRKPYNRYIKHVKQTAICLCPAGMENKIDASALKLIPYKTRFTAIDRQLTLLDRYTALWDESKHYYQDAVFLTLTTDPAKHETLWHANRHFQVAWNRYMSLLTKRNKKAAKKAGEYEEQESYRPKYLCVYEFQQNMLLHCHCILFGISRIASDYQISADWDRCGQGRITKQIPLTLKNNQWGWKHQKPADAHDGESPEKYLKKYLNKAIHGHEDFELYWAFNKRFMSTSRTLDPCAPPHHRQKPEHIEPAGTLTDRNTGEKIEYWNEKPKKPEKPAPPRMWTYIGTITGGIFPQWLLKKFRTNRQPLASNRPLNVPGNTKPWWSRKIPEPKEQPDPEEKPPTPPPQKTQALTREQLADLEWQAMQERRKHLKKTGTTIHCGIDRRL